MGKAWISCVSAFWLSGGKIVLSSNTDTFSAAPALRTVGSGLMQYCSRFPGGFGEAGSFREETLFYPTGVGAVTVGSYGIGVAQFTDLLTLKAAIIARCPRSLYVKAHGESQRRKLFPFWFVDGQNMELGISMTRLPTI